MKCKRCHNTIEAGEEKEHLGQTLCEGCYMDACPFVVFRIKDARP